MERTTTYRHKLFTSREGLTDRQRGCFWDTGEGIGLRGYTARLLAGVCTMCVCMLLPISASADTFGSGSNVFTMDFATISSASNPSVSPGVVSYDYRIAITEVTNDQWDKFEAELGVAVTGQPATAYDKDSSFTGADLPVESVSWYEAAQFVNWLNTSTGNQPAYKFTGKQGQSDYSLTLWDVADRSSVDAYRHKDAKYFIPTADEWVKAAYWNGAVLQTYANKSGEAVNPYDWRYTSYDVDPDVVPASPWDVASGNQELNGTYDMMGNVWEWVDASNPLRGGAYGSQIADLSNTGTVGVSTSYEGGNLGFRVASTADAFGSGENAFTMNFVTISPATNPTGGAGVVTYEYRIAITEVTNDQWDKFEAELGVAVTGQPATAYDKDSSFTGADLPVESVSWYEAAQFVNWLNTSTGNQPAYKFTGTQGQSDYSLTLWDVADRSSVDAYRHKDAKYFIPTADEWVKAAYWNGSTLQTYANASAADLVGGEPDPAKWNYAPSAGSAPWMVSSGAGELNGTYDMMGNVWEWVDASHPLRGGAYGSQAADLSSTGTVSVGTDYEGSNLGFRVASRLVSVIESCNDVKEQGFGLASDLNGDCYVEWADFGIFASQWQSCVDPADAGCDSPWE